MGKIGAIACCAFCGVIAVAALVGITQPNLIIGLSAAATCITILAGLLTGR